MAHSSPAPRRLPITRLAFAALLIGSCAVYALLWVIEFGGEADAPGLFALWSEPAVAAPLASLSEVIVAVLGIALTVVAILVQLAGYRYTPRITELFVRDPINMLAIGGMVITTVLVIWVNMSLYGPKHPATMVLVTLVAVSLSVLGLLPYFAYIFAFLTPDAIIGRIRTEAVDAFRDLARRGEPGLERARVRVLSAIEHLDDMAQNAVKKDDKAIALRAMEALGQILHENLAYKLNFPDAWFATERLREVDQDFVTLHPDMIRSLQERRIWVEMKVLRGFELSLKQSLNRIPDISHLAAIHGRRFAAKAIAIEDTHALRLTVRYFNTFLRHSVNAGDVRSAYNILNEYRQVAELLLIAGEGDRVVEFAERLKYYGHLAFHRRMNFVLETCAQDLCELLETAHERGAPCHDAVLEVFLEIDREPYDGGTQQEASLRGVRKAQVKLAAYYLSVGDTPHARRIYEDMKEELPARLTSIRSEFALLDDPEWWEVANRDTNWDYLELPLREQLPTFFGWFENLEPMGAV